MHTHTEDAFMFDSEQHNFSWDFICHSCQTTCHWTCELFIFCLLKCSRHAAGEIVSEHNEEDEVIDWETTTDWRVFVKVTVCFHLLQPYCIFHICQRVSVSHFWSRGIKFHRNKIFGGLFFCFSSVVLLLLLVNLAPTSSKPSLAASCSAEIFLFRAWLLS